MKIFIDTSVFVDILRTGDNKSSKGWFFYSFTEGNEGYSSVISLAELSVGAYRSQREDAVEKPLINCQLLI